MAKTPKRAGPATEVRARPPVVEEEEARPSPGAVDARIEGVGVGLVDEVVAAAAPPPEDDDAGGLGGRPGRDDVRKAAPGADLLGGGEAAAGPPAGERPEVRDAGLFDLLDQPGEADSDPLTSFLAGAEGKLGRDTGLTGPSDQGNASPANGKPSVGREKDFIGPDTKEEFEDRNGVFIGPQQEIRSQFDQAFQPSREKEEAHGPYAPTEENEDVPAEGSIPPPAEDDEDEDDHEDEVTGEADPPHDPPPSPLPDERAPLPQDLQDQLDADVARFGRLRRNPGDGTTDPSEIESEVVGPAGELPDHAELGESLFGRPDQEVESGSGAGNVNAGADSQGAGVVTPGEDQSVDVGATRDDEDPFAAIAPDPEPPVGVEDDADVVSLVPSAVESPVDDGPDLPDLLEP